jgi:hypothetical protein
VGGIGGSRRRRGEGSTRQTRLATDHLPAIDVRSLKRNGLIAPRQERVDLLTRFRMRSRALAPPGRYSTPTDRLTKALRGNPRPGIMRSPSWSALNPPCKRSVTVANIYQRLKS